MKKGIFWCVDANTSHPKLIVVSVRCNPNGDVESSVVLSSKSGENFNHKAEWEKLDKRVKGNIAYNYYPRGRVEIKNRKATIFLNPDIDREPIIQVIRREFELRFSDELNCITVKRDGSRHYQYINK